MKLNHQLMLLAAIVVATAPVLARGPDELPLGKPARALQVDEWVSGEPVTLAAGKDQNIFVIVFWATKCPHSRACLPRLNEMQKRYKDKGVIFVAISAEPVETVRAFIEKQGSETEYRVAVDKLNITTGAYLRSVFIDKIPYAFVIDKSGKLVWYGHPMSGLDKTIDAVIAGTYDIEICNRRDRARKRLPGYFATACSPRHADKASGIGEKIIEDGQADIMLMNEFAWKIATQPGLIKRDLDLAMRAAQIAYDACEGKDAGIVDTYARVLWESDRKKEAIEYQKRAIKLAEQEEMRKELEKTLAKYEKAVEGD